MNSVHPWVHTSAETVERRQLLLASMLFICGFLAAQRFTLDPVNAAICAVPYVMFAFNMSRADQRAAMSCLVLALFLSVDNGAGVYAETVAPLRYLIYASVIVVLFRQSRWCVKKQSLVLATLLCCGILVGSLTSSLAGEVYLDTETLRRDLLVLLILSVFLLPRSSVRLDLQLLYTGSLGFLAGEVINALFFFKDSNEYLSYNSLKAFIVFPLIYSAIKRKSIFIRATLSVLTPYIIFLYGTRMIVVSAISLFLVASIMHAIRSGYSKILLAISIASFLLINLNLFDILNDGGFLQFKAIAFLFQARDIIKDSDFNNMFLLLDPVRFAEHQLFFDRPIMQIFLGSGLGSGIFDSNGLLGFVTFDQTAFSENEINSSTYFGFHDFWIDFGLRFGMLPIIYLLFRLTLFPMWRKYYVEGALFGLILINTTFATSGILLIALLVRLWPEKRFLGGSNA